MSSPVTEVPAPPRLGRGVVALLAVATGLTVANLWYAQPLLELMRAGLGLRPGTAGLIVTLTQVGYVAGLVFVLPLGDLLQRRSLVVGLSVANAVALAAMASARNVPTLLAAAVAVGLLSVAAQFMIPFAAALAADDERGRAVGTVMSGLLLGILLARTFAGYVARFGGWPSVYWIAAVLMLAQAVALRRGLPVVAPTAAERYPALLRSVATLVRDEPVLRLRAVYGALAFAMFSVLWTALTFLLSGPPYRYPASVIGLFGLFGVAGTLGANVAGRFADRGRGGRNTAAGVTLLLLSWGALYLGGRSLAALIAGIVVLDLAVQLTHVTNQSEIYRLRPSARNRLTSAYMIAYFVGGATGSALASFTFAALGWGGVCALGAAFGTAGVTVWLVAALTARRGGEGRQFSRSSNGTPNRVDADSL